MIANVSGVKISSIMACVPKGVREIISDSEDKRTQRLIRSTGFTRLRISDNNDLTSDLCVYAIESMFEKLGFDRKLIDGLVFVTQYPDYITPASSYIIQKRLGLSNDIALIDINQGCSGYIYGLYVASMMVKSGLKHVLLCVGDVSGSQQKGSQAGGVTSLFGDCGAVTLLEADEKYTNVAFYFKSYGEKYDAIIRKASGYRLVSSGGGTVNDKYTCMNGMDVMEFTLTKVPADIRDYLVKINEKSANIDLFAVHQAQKSIVNSLADVLNVDRAKMPFTAGEVGNTSSASIPLLLNQIHKEDYGDMKKVCLCGFGVGLAVGVVVVNLSDSKFLGVVEK